VPGVLPVVGFLRGDGDEPGVNDVEERGGDNDQRGPRGIRKPHQILRAVWCSSRTISPPLNTRTVPVVWETEMAMALVSTLMAAAALWRAPNPSGSSTSWLTAWRYRP